LRRWRFDDESRCGGCGLVELNDGRGILDLRGGTGGTGLGAIILLFVNEFIEGDGTIVLFVKRVCDTDDESLSVGVASPLLAGIGGCGRLLVRNDVVGFLSDVDAVVVVEGNFERFIFIFILVITVDFGLMEVKEDFGLIFVEVSEIWSRNVGDVRGKSVSSKLRESDFDATDNELLLRWSSRFDGIIKLLLICWWWFPLVKWYWCPYGFAVVEGDRYDRFLSATEIDGNCFLGNGVEPIVIAGIVWCADRRFSVELKHW